MAQTTDTRVRTYRYKPSTVQAVQWDEKGSTAEEIERWSEGRVVTDRSGNERNLVVTTRHGAAVAKYSDWVVRSDDGHFWVCETGIFHEKYAPA